MTHRRPRLSFLSNVLSVFVALIAAFASWPASGQSPVHPATARLDATATVLRRSARALEAFQAAATDSTVAIADDGFEEEFPGSWAVSYGGPEAWWWPTSYRAWAGARSVYCAGGGNPAAPAGGPYYPSMNTWMVYGPFSLADASAARATFEYWGRLEAPEGTSYYDTFSWMVSVDGDHFHGFKTAGDSGGWVSREFDFSDVTSITVLGQPQVWFALVFNSDDSVQYEGAYVDALRIEKTVAGPTCTLTCSASAPATGTAGAAVAFSGSATPSNCSGAVSYLWDFGDMTAASSAQSPSHTYAAAGTYAWQMTAAAGGKSCVKSGSITIGSGDGEWGPYAAWIPVASHAPGVNQSQWRTDLGVLNLAAVTANLELRFHGSGGTLASTASVAPGAQAIFADVVEQFHTSGSGALEVRSDQAVQVTARTYTQEADGRTYGQGFDGLPATKGAAAGQVVYLPQLVENADYRTNIALTNAGTTSATATVELMDGNGTKLTQYAVSLSPGQWRQESRPFMTKAGRSNITKGYARITIASGSGLVAYGSVVDNRTNDPTTITMKSASATTASSIWVPVASHAPGVNASQWRTDVGILNTGAATASLQFRFYAGSKVLTGSASVPAGAQEILADVVDRIFHTSGSGALEITSTQPLIVTSRTYTQEATGETFGQSFDGVLPSAMASTGQVLYLPQLVETADYRTNIALANTGAQQASVLVELFDGAGGKLTQYTASLAKGQWKQESRPFYLKAGLTNLLRGYARVTVNSGTGIVAVASVVDNATNDPTTIPMKRPEPVGPTFTLITNATDSELLEVKGSDGTVVQYYGTRDDDGVPNSLDRVKVTDTEGGVSSIELDDQMRPAKVRAPNGAYFELTYLGDDTVAVSAVAPDGSAQVNTTFVIGQAPEGVPGCGCNGSAFAAPAVRAAGGAPSGGTAELFAALSATGDVTVQVARCGAPVANAQVVVYLSSAGDLMSTWQGPAANVGGGRYVASVPTNAKPTLDGEKLRSSAEWLAGHLGNMCTALSLSGHPEAFMLGMCPAIGLALTTVTGPGGAAIGAACLKVSAAVLAYCATLGEGGAPGLPSLAERILDGLKDPRVTGGEVTLKADAWTPGLSGLDVSDEVSVSASGPFPTLIINVPDSPRIGSLALDPANPGVLEGYDVEVQVICAEEDDALTISMVGTDGYTKSQTFVVDTPGTKDYSMHVPGGALGVRDVVTVTLTSRLGTETRTASLVFGG